MFAHNFKRRALHLDMPLICVLTSAREMRHVVSMNSAVTMAAWKLGADFTDLQHATRVPPSMVQLRVMSGSGTTFHTGLAC